ncbi:iron dependent repressor, metal binding and dimerization domain protein [Intestinimonas butyriciproducens]|uniref:iron dependent repressor, metal binding and dimerization domain protein n=1 Tax=Intestinimonas butyriciproducens TaxID=1297617 RepID=UPI0009E6F4D6|nr:iron dependent repressor, metal binding and dimerization domain protein [Intestinimonas butyriciproducens]
MGRGSPSPSIRQPGQCVLCWVCDEFFPRGQKVEDFYLHLTDIDHEIVEQTYEKRCFFTYLLTEAGVDPKTAEQDACRMEHMISENSFRHLKQSMDKKE